MPTYRGLIGVMLLMLTCYTTLLDYGNHIINGLEFEKIDASDKENKTKDLRKKLLDWDYIFNTDFILGCSEHNHSIFLSDALSAYQNPLISKLTPPPEVF